VAAVYQKRKHVLELGLREDGSRASKKASMIARNVARAAAWGASINVRVQEQDGAHDHRVSLGANPFAFSELQLHSRREQPKKSISKKQQGGSGKQNQKDKQPQQQSQSHPEQKDENGTAYCCSFSLAFANRKLLTAYEWHSNAEQETIESPVDWITLDPEKEWLLHDVTYQPQRCWEAILERDKYGLFWFFFLGVHIMHQQKASSWYINVHNHTLLHPTGMQRDNSKQSSNCKSAFAPRLLFQRLTR